MTGEQDVKPDELRRLSDAARPGPWSIVKDPGFKAGHIMADRTVADVRYSNGHNDGPFIVTLVNAYRSGALIVKEPTNEQ